MSDFLDVVQKRRSVYALSGSGSLEDARLEQMLKDVILDMPTAYNMQSTRMVLLLGGAHQKLWGIVMETLRQRVKPENFGRTEDKINSFAAGHGTVLFFDDTAVTERFKTENPAYAQNFDPWALQQNGMLQFAVWALLAEQGMGASLQHYNPLIDDEVKSTFGLPRDWLLLAQMPFGVATVPAGPKERQPIETRFKRFDTV